MKSLPGETTLPTDSDIAVSSEKKCGSLTVLVPGTEWRKFGGWGEDNALFRLATEVLGQDADGARTEFFEWPGGNSHRSRLEAAEALRDLITGHALSPNDKLHLIGHSHGGNVALLASNLGLTHAIDNLITLNKPTLTGSSYEAGENVRRFFNISARRDWLQWAGSNAKLSLTKWAMDPKAMNLLMDTSSSDLHPHAALIWDDGIRADWYAWLQKQIDLGAHAQPD